jgi:O-acetylhomoserine (thiol)-lyase
VTILRNLYGGTYTQFENILPKFGISVNFVDITDPSKVKEAIDDKTQAIFCETVSNPALEITPLEDIAEIANEAETPLVVDDKFTTPYLCRPFDWGASIVLTKWTGGHGTGIGGIVVDSGKFDWSKGKHPLFTENDTSYGGLRWGIDLPEALAPLAYILRMRTGPLRNLGACISPDNR